MGIETQLLETNAFGSYMEGNGDVSAGNGGRLGGRRYVEHSNEGVRFGSIFSEVDKL